MYITEINLSGVRCFDAVKIELNEPGTSLLICGNNGSGKTALLRSIAMGLCDNTSSGSLLRDLPGDFIRKESGQEAKDRSAEIKLQVSDTDSVKDTYEITTMLETKPNMGFETVETMLVDPKGEILDPFNFPWHKIFVTGYGAGLRTNGYEDYAQYFSSDSVYSLFDYSYPLTNPEISWRRLQDVCYEYDEKIDADEIIKKPLQTILCLEDSEDIKLRNNGIFVKSDWGEHELDALGDGYRAIVTMALDLMAWLLLAKNHDVILEAYERDSNGDEEELQWDMITDFKEETGIVIIDEIEKHLHPKYQHTVISKFKEAFPKMQFIISTHSPLCVSGVADTNENDFIIISSHRNPEESGAVTLHTMPSPRGLTADDVYRIYFEITDTRNKTLQNALEMYRNEYLKENPDPKELERLKTELQNCGMKTSTKSEKEAMREKLEKGIEEIAKKLETNND